MPQKQPRRVFQNYKCYKSRASSFWSLFVLVTKENLLTESTLVLLQLDFINAQIEGKMMGGIKQTINRLPEFYTAGLK